MYSRYLKRPIDLSLSLLLVLLFSWLFLLIVLAYLLTLQLPVFFLQARTGRNEHPFTLIKFRTLRNGAGPLHERRFPLGNFLRFTSLDELPQLWNVVKGDMSLVGPRPLPEAYLPRYSTEQRERHSVKPGITGWAQVNGRHSVSWNEKFRCDLYYIKNMSLALDIKIIFKTARILFSFKRDVSLEEKPFEGVEGW